MTGGASGLGRATAQVLAADGAAVLIADINAERAFAAADDLTQRGYAGSGSVLTSVRRTGSETWWPRQ